MFGGKDSGKPLLMMTLSLGGKMEGKRDLGRGILVEERGGGFAVSSVEKLLRGISLG